VTPFSDPRFEDVAAVELVQARLTVPALVTMVPLPDEANPSDDGELFR
jgi:AMMECR1 domain-containing protein